MNRITLLDIIAQNIPAIKMFTDKNRISPHFSNGKQIKPRDDKNYVEIKLDSKSSDLSKILFVGPSSRLEIKHPVTGFYSNDGVFCFETGLMYTHYLVERVFENASTRKRYWDAFYVPRASIEDKFTFCNQN